MQCLFSVIFCAGLTYCSFFDHALFLLVFTIGSQVHHFYHAVYMHILLKREYIVEQAHYTAD